MREKGNACRRLLGKQEKQRLFGRLRWRWVDNIKVDIREIG
jgi:hypothetical protein